MRNLVKVVFIKEEYSIWDMPFQKKGVAVDPTKIKVILEWSIPKDVHNIIFFMVLTRYYRIFTYIFLEYLIQ